MSQQKLNELNRTSFEYEGKRFDVVDVKRQFEKNVIKTKQRVFVFFDEEFTDFLSKIKMIDPLEKPAYTPQKNEVVETKVVNIIEHRFVIPEESMQVTDALMNMFNKLSGAPTEEDYKQAKAMSEMADTIVKVEQTKINFLRLQKSH